MKMNTHKYYDLAYQAYYWTSFSPEKRAVSECEYYNSVIKELEDLGADQRALDKFEKLFLSALNAKSKCMSAMITGLAKFPVARAERANQRERVATDTMLDFVDKIKKIIDRKNNPDKYQTCIKSDDPEALDKLKKKLAFLEETQDQMKSCNIKAKIKTVKERIASLEKIATIESKEIIVNGVRIVQNIEAQRVQFFFDGKLEKDIIALMKKNAFKWSPSNVCWQRLFNNNCIYAVKRNILPVLRGEI
jgi:hypothetical protein